MSQPYPKRLIEVDLPIRAISAHARREKSIRHGHISTLHIWWARRPLAACRAVLCAALWPDPADEHCPAAFREAAALALNGFAEQVRSDANLARLCAAHWTRWVRTTPASLKGDQAACWPDMRYALLDFIADFANWDASTVPAFLETARLLTHVAHLTLSGQITAISDLPLAISTPLPTSLPTQIQNLKEAIQNLPRPLVVDPFAGGGSIPLEALRVGAEAFASDLNPVAVLLNKVVLEYIPKYGKARIEMQDAQGQPIVFNGLAEAVRYWGGWIKEQAEKELAEFYPKDPDGATPIAYLWARTIICEGPGCGAEVPLMRSLWLAKKGERSVGLRIKINRDEQDKQDKNFHQVSLIDRDGQDKQDKNIHLAPWIDFEIIEKHKGKWYPQNATGNAQAEIKNSQFEGTVRRGSATCPVCGYTTPVERVRSQLKERHGGATDARLISIVTTHPQRQGRFYRLPVKHDLVIIQNGSYELERRLSIHDGRFSLVPDESTIQYDSFVNRGPIYGMERWKDYYSPRQALALSTLSILTQHFGKRLVENSSTDIAIVLQVLLGLAVDRQVDATSSLCRWHITRELNTGTFGRQALPIVWDFSEVNVLSESTGGFLGAIEWISKVCEANKLDADAKRYAELVSATHHPLPDDSANGWITDPPYYYSVQYSDLSDFFYVWLKRSLDGCDLQLFDQPLTPKNEEIIVQSPSLEFAPTGKNRAFYEEQMKQAMKEGRRVLAPDGVGVVVFAHTSTAGWEALLQAMVDAGWIITGSWPIDTEMSARVISQGRSVLASSIHLVCRPREGAGGELIESIGDWRDVLAELPERIHAWLPHLAQEGVVGADAIFACLGPALEIFSRYSRVEKASGEQVTLKDYLEVVWAEVAREALGMIFEGADASGFEEDARLTAMWLWTLSTREHDSETKDEGKQAGFEEGESEDEGEETPHKAETTRGYLLEYDAARKIAQGLGAHLERLESLVEVKGDKARLRSVSERAHALFGRQEDEILGKRKKKTTGQMSLFNVLDEVEAQESGWVEEHAPAAGATSLDRLHQAMLLFATGRGEGLKRFLVEEGVGKDQQFWRLAQALSALYPAGSDEKRWVDGVLARKKGLGY